MKVLIPSSLRPLTGAPEVDASGRTLGELIADLDRQFPGLRLKVLDEHGQLRRHLRCFVNHEQALELSHRLAPDDSVQLLQALSGG